MVTHDVFSAAQLLKCSPRSLLDRRYRVRHGIQARRVGRRLVFLESDLFRILERGREPLPGEGRR